MVTGKCICCNKRSRSVMGPKCGALKCKCKGVYCLHDGTRLKLYKVRSVSTNAIYFPGGHSHPWEELELVKCDKCGCAWTGHPENSTLQSSFTCNYVLESTTRTVAAS